MRSSTSPPEGLVALEWVQGLSFDELAQAVRRAAAPAGLNPLEIGMTEAFICDAVRTPIGRYGGALSGVRTDDLGRDPAARAAGAQPEARSGGDRGSAVRLRQPGRRGQPQRRTDGAAAGRVCRRKCRLPPSTACAVRAWTRSAPSRAPSAPARSNSALPAASRACRARRSSCRRPRRAFSRCQQPSTTPPSAGASSTRR